MGAAFYIPGFLSIPRDLCLLDINNNPTPSTSYSQKILQDMPEVPGGRGMGMGQGGRVGRTSLFENLRSGAVVTVKQADL